MATHIDELNRRRGGGGQEDSEIATSQSFSAPTPYNTYFSPSIHEVSEDVQGDTSVADVSNSRTSGSFDNRPEPYPNQGDGDVSFGPSVSFSSPSHGHGHDRSTTYSASHASAHLISPSRSFDPTASIIPPSNVSIPAPPSRLSSAGTRSSSFPILDNGLEGSSASASSSSSVPKSKWSWRGRKKLKMDMTQDDRDAQRLQQLGYDAVLGREYNFWSSLAITTLNIGALQGTVLAVKNTYEYGGPQMILVAWPMSGLFSFFLTLTLSELASAYPVAGAMASWAWKCARGGVGGERKWGWLLGGVVLAGHAAAVVLVTWEICDIISGTMAMATSYEPRTWHSVLFFLAILLFLGCVGTTATGRSHKFWICGGIYGLSVWAILCISVLVSENHKGGGIRTDRFYNHSGWGSKAYVYLLGWQYSTIASGVDASAHMAEETKNPSRNVPNAMAGSMVLTYVLAYISIVLLLLSISPEDGDDISNHAFPFGFVLQKATSHKAAVAIIVLLIFVLLLQVLAQLQASSRFLFALARDNALPFSASIRKTNANRVPVMAHWLAIFICMPFAFLLIGGLRTLRGVLAVTCSSLAYAGYVTPVILYLLSRKNLQLEGRTSWSLRRLSKPFACVGVLFALGVIVVQTLPGARPVTARNVSWSPLVLASTGVLTVVTWYAYGRKHYSGPIRAVTKWETGVEIDLASTLGPKSRPSGHQPSNFDITNVDGVEIDIDSKGEIDPNEAIEPTTTVTVARSWSLDDEEATGEWSDVSALDSRGTMGQSQIRSRRSSNAP